MTIRDPENPDVVVVGGGMTGLAVSLALAQAGCACAVLDAAPLVADQPASGPPDPRASAIAYANMRMLDALGAGDALRAAAGRMERILVTDGRAPDRSGLPVGPGSGPSSAFLRFDAKDLPPEAGDEPLAFMVANTALRQELGRLVAAESRITVHAPVTVADIAFEADRAVVRADDGRVWRASLAVGAEAQTAAVRRAAGIRVHGWTYPQKGVVTAVQLERSHDNTAHEYFLPSGPFAILPLPDNRASLVWTERAEAADAAVRLPDDVFASEIQRRFGPFLGAVTVEGPRFAFPLKLAIAERFVAPRAALAGDPARTVHPIAGQGFNLALKDAAALAEVVRDARAVGEDIGALIVLERYQHWRRFDSALMAFATDGLNRLFSNDAAPVRWMRDAGLAVVNRVDLARRTFARDAGADLGALPQLLRGERLDAGRPTPAGL